MVVKKYDLVNYQFHLSTLQGSVNHHYFRSGKTKKSKVWREYTNSPSTEMTNINSTCGLAQGDTTQAIFYAGIIQSSSVDTDFQSDSTTKNLTLDHTTTDKLGEMAFPHTRMVSTNRAPDAVVRIPGPVILRHSLHGASVHSVVWSDECRPAPPYLRIQWKKAVWK